MSKHSVVGTTAQKAGITPFLSFLVGNPEIAEFHVIPGEREVEVRASSKSEPEAVESKPKAAGSVQADITPLLGFLVGNPEMAEFHVIVGEGEVEVRTSSKSEPEAAESKKAG